MVLCCPHQLYPGSPPPSSYLVPHIITALVSSQTGWVHYGLWHIRKIKGWKSETTPKSDQGSSSTGWTWVGGLGSQCLRAKAELVSMFKYCMSISQFHNKYRVANSINYITSEPFISSVRIHHKNRIEHVVDMNWGPAMVPLLFKLVVNNSGLKVESLGWI